MNYGTRGKTEWRIRFVRSFGLPVPDHLGTIGERVILPMIAYFLMLGFVWYLAKGAAVLVAKLIACVFVSALKLIVRFVILPAMNLLEYLAKRAACLLSYPAEEGARRGKAPDTPLNPGETIIRQYHAAVSKPHSCDVYLTVTNQRVIVSGCRLTFWGGARSRIFQQVSIAGVSAVNTGYTRVTSRLWFCLYFAGLSLARYAYVCWRAAEKFTGLVPIIFPNMGANANTFPLVFFNPGSVSRYFSGSSFGVWGALFLAASYIQAQRWLFALQIQSAAASASITLGEGYGGKSALLGLRGQPTGHSEVLTRELGQLVSDVQLNGDDAVRRWRAKEPPLKARDEMLAAAPPCCADSR
jgi:hypothetical protein